MRRVCDEDVHIWAFHLHVIDAFKDVLELHAFHIHADGNRFQFSMLTGMIYFLFSYFRS